jgi:hypothetical protein
MRINSSALANAHARKSPRLRRAALSVCEMMEQRVLLSISFLANPYTTPANRTDVPLGTLSGFAPVEPMLRVNPADPANLVASSHNGARLTTNGGATFSGGFSFAVPPGTNTSGGDTDMAYDSAGRLYWINLRGNGTTGISVSRINPATGASFSSVLVSNGPSDDKGFITCDATATSPFANNVYVIWTRFAATVDVFFSRSTDLGLTWSAPMQLSSSATEGFVWPSDVNVAPNGDVYVAYHANPGTGTSGRVIVRRSTNGGVSFAAGVNAFAPGQADLTFNVQTSGGTIPGTQFWTQGSVQPWVLPDPSRPGNVYVVTNDDPNNIFGNGDNGDIVFSRSTNNGASWTTSTISAGPGGSFQLFPSASIDRFGDIVVAWYDNRRGLTNGAGRFLLDVMATYSRDGGLTWAPEFMVNDASNPFDPDPGAVNRFAGPPPTTRIGEYFGSDLFGGTAHLAWNGNSFSGATPVGHQVWYNDFAISGTLGITGDDTGVSNDTITLQTLAGNASYFEVLVNGVRQYAGLKTAITGITINGLGGNDTINLTDTPAGIPVTVNGGVGNDIINIGNGNLDALATSITVDGGTDTDTVNINDSTATFNDTYTVTSSTLSRIAFTLNYLNLESLALSSETGSNLYNINSTSLGTTLSITDNGGIDVFNVGAGNLDNLPGPVVINAGALVDSINVNDNGASFSDTYTINATSITRIIFGGLTFANAENVTLNAETGSNSITINGMSSTVALVVNGNDGNDTFIQGVQDLNNNWLGDCTINGGNDTDLIVLNDNGDLTAGEYTITPTTFQITAGVTTHAFVYGTVEGIQWTTNTQGTPIQINGTAAGTPVTINANAGTDTINVKETAVGAPVSILSSTGDDAVNVNTDGGGSATALFVETQRIGALTIAAGGTAQLTVGLSKVLSMTSVSVTGAARLDLTDNDAIVDYTGGSPLAAVRGLLASGYNAALWNGNGINSAVAASNAAKTTALGISEAPAGGGTFSGVTVDGTALLIKYTWYGDANLSGDVDTIDFNLVAANFGGGNKHWALGDFNYDTVVDTVDFNLLAANFGSAGLAPAPGVAYVPPAPLPQAPRQPAPDYSLVSDVFGTDRILA